MPTPEIVERVRRLHAELEATQPDPAHPQAPVIDTIKQQTSVVILEPTHAPHFKSLSDLLLYHYVGFQLDYPKLAASMETLANELAKAGI